VGQGAIVNRDGSVNYETNPVARGTSIQIYDTGGGTGSVAQSSASLLLAVGVTIGGPSTRRSMRHAWRRAPQW